MSGIDRDLNQFSLFPPVVKPGRMRNLSGRAAELAAVEIMKQQIDPGATSFKNQVEVSGFRPDVFFRFGGSPILLEVKSVKHGSKILIRREQQEAMHKCPHCTLYGFLIHRTSTKGIVPVDLIPAYLEEATLYVTTSSHVTHLLDTVGKPYKHSKDTLFKDAPPAGSKEIKIGWQRYNWMEIPGAMIRDCQTCHVWRMKFNGNGDSSCNC